MERKEKGKGREKGCEREEKRKGREKEREEWRDMEWERWGGDERVGKEIKLVATLYIPAVLRINDRTITVLNTQ